MTLLFHRYRNPLCLLLTATLLALGSTAGAAEPLDINTAHAKQIAKAMKGVGMKIAKRIVAFREEHGPFPTIEALVEVRGVGKRTLERNRDRIAAMKPDSKGRHK